MSPTGRPTVAERVTGLLLTAALMQLADLAGVLRWLAGVLGLAVVGVWILVWRHDAPQQGTPPALPHVQAAAAGYEHFALVALGGLIITGDGLWLVVAGLAVMGLFGTWALQAGLSDPDPAGGGMP